MVRLYESLPCRCSYTIAHFAVVVNNFLVAAGAFVCCCIRVACGRPLEVCSRPRAGGGWAPAGLVSLQAAALRTACGVAVIRAGRQRLRWWPAGRCAFGGWAFRCLTASGGCGGSVAAAATGRSPYERRAVRVVMPGTKKGLDKIGGVWYGVGCREHFAKCVNLAKTCYSLQFTFSEIRVGALDDSKHRGPFFGVSGKEVKNGKVQ